MRIAVLVFFGVQKHSVNAQKFDDLRICVEDILSAEVFDLGDEISRGIDGVVDLEPILLPYVEVVSAVAGCGVNGAGARFSG